MIKYKIERSAGKTLLVIQGQKGQQISEREYYALNTGQIPGLLRAEVVKKGNIFKINYNISGYISLREFLFNPLNKESFARLLSSILTILKSLQTAYFNQQYILMDMNAAMLNPSTHEVSFVYVPITFYENGTNLKDFLLSIIQCCSFFPGEDTDYVRDYIRILNNGINFSVFDLEEYVKRLGVDSPTGQREKKCSKCGAILQPNVNFCSSCGMKIGGLVSNNAQGVYNPLQNISIPQIASEQREHFEPPQKPSNFSNTVANSLSAESNKPAVKEHQPNPNAYLYRVKTGEQIVVSAPSFRIGKDPYNNEYCVRDNSAISRCHVVIKFMSNKWFLTDLNSTNKTYINDRAIYPNMDVELCGGMSIRLANEGFIFNTY